MGSLARSDFYSLLEVSRQAGPAEIKAAYRRLAVKWHPDRNQGSALAEEKFKAIAEAYAVLSNAEKRTRYDRLGPDGFSHEFSQEDIFKGFDLNDFFREFGLEDAKEAFARAFSPSQQSRYQAEPGLEKHSRPPVQFFSGFGQPPQRNHNNHDEVIMPLSVSLGEACFGAKKVVAVNARRGVIKAEVAIPEGSRQGDLIRVTGEAARAAEAEAVIVQLVVRPEPGFRVRGQDILMKHQVPESFLGRGGPTFITTLEGKSLCLNVPPGTALGACFKIPGHGLKGASGQRGNLIVKLVAPMVPGLRN